MLRHAPALRLALPFACGVFVGGLLSGDARAALGHAGAAPAAAVLVAALAAAPLRRARHVEVVLSLLLGAARGLEGAPSPVDSTFSYQAVETWGGRVTAQRVSGFRIGLVRGLAPDGASTVRLTGDVDVRADGPAPGVGAWVAVPGQLEALEGSRNPGLPDARLLARRDRVVARLRATGPVRTLAASGWGGRLAARLARWRARFAAREDALYPPDIAPYMRALFLGDRSLLEPSLRWDFRDTGTAHLLALSGQHVILIALLVERGIASLGVPYALRVPADLAALALYLALVGAPASIARAGVVLAVFLLARPLRRRFDAGNALGLALLFLLALNPEDLWDPGLTLSFGATAGLIFLLPLLRERIAAGSRRLDRLIVDPLRVTLAASWPLAPLEGALFGAVPIAGLAANLLLVPATGLLLGLHVGVLACAALPWEALRLPSPVPDIAAATALLGRATILGVRAAARVLPPPLVLPSAWAPIAALYAIASLLLLRPPRALRGSGALLVPLTALVVAGLPVDPPLRVVLYDVGQGDAILVASRARRLLVDAGPSFPGWDAGERAVVPALRAAGIHRVDALLLSHGDADHSGGAAAVIDAIDVRLLIEPDAGIAPRTRTHARVRESAARRGARSVAVAEGEMLRLAEGRRASAAGADPITARVLHPPLAPAPSPSEAHGNNRSIVLDLACGRVHMLLTGDLPAEEERRLVARGNLPRGAILKVGHHGSRGSTGAAFLTALHPPASLISAGVRNRYGHPHPELLARLEAEGARVMRTDREGALTLETDGTRVVVWGALRKEAPLRIIYIAPGEPHAAGALPRAPFAAVPTACD